MQLTECDKKMLDKIPKKKWFKYDDLSPRIKNRDYRIRRLEKLGFLKSNAILGGISVYAGQIEYYLEGNN